MTLKLWTLLLLASSGTILHAGDSSSVWPASLGAAIWLGNQIQEVFWLDGVIYF
jgi:hypothetical protein